MKKIICFLLLLCLSIGISACANKVDSLLEDGDYAGALALMEKNPAEYGEAYDRTRFFVAQSAFDSGELDRAAALLQNNPYTGAAALLEKVNYHIALHHIEQGEYEAALPYLEKNTFDGAASALEEVKFQLAKAAADRGEYETAVSYLEGNTFEGAERLLDEVNYRWAEVLLSSENYRQAISLLEDNRYVYAGTLLKEARNLGAAMETEAFFNEILSQIGKDNSGTNYYNQLCDALDETYKIIQRDGHLDNARSQFSELFGYEPLSVNGAKSDIEKLKKALQFEYFYDSPFIEYVVLDYLTEVWGRTSIFAHFELTETHGSMIIDQPYEFLKKASISPKTLSLLLGAFVESGAQVTREGGKIIITFEPTRPDGSLCRGYYHCAPDSQEQLITAFFRYVKFDFYDAYLTDEGLYVTVEFSTPTRYYLRHFSVDLILMDKDGNWVTGTSRFVENISDMTIIFNVFFEGVTSDNLPQDSYMLWYYLAAVMN